MCVQHVWTGLHTYIYLCVHMHVLVYTCIHMPGTHVCVCMCIHPLCMDPTCVAWGLLGKVSPRRAPPSSFEGKTGSPQLQKEKQKFRSLQRHVRGCRAWECIRVNWDLQKVVDGESEATISGLWWSQRERRPHCSGPSCQSQGFCCICW